MSDGSSTPTVTAQLSDFAAGLRFEQLPAAVVDHVERLVLDTLGCALGGSTTPLGTIAQRFAAASGEAGQASVAGSGERTSALLAAGANGRMAGVLDADDTFASAGQTSHHGAPTVAAALALAERDGRSGADLICAIAAGYEVGARVGAAVPAHAPAPAAGGGFKVGGGAAGVLAPTVAAARLLELDGAHTAHALGIAGAHVDVPPLKWFEGRVAPMVKSMDCGWNATTGVSAAQLAGLGMTGHADILDGPNGLWRALGQASFEGEIAAGALGERWWTLDASFKLLPCQYWMLSALRALSVVLDEHALEPDEIESVLLRTNSRSGSPRFRDQHPEGFVTGAFNFPHAAAMLALRVPPGPRWLDERALADPRAQALREKVEVEIDPRTKDVGALVVDGMMRRMPGSALVRARGEVFEASVEAGLGGPWDEDTRIGDAALRGKLANMVEPLELPGRADAIFALAGTLRDLPDVREVGALLRA